MPRKLNVPADPLKLRLDFHEQAICLHSYEGDLVKTKIVSALDVAKAIANELTYSTGLMPDDTLWWTNTADGAVTAIYQKPQKRLIALQTSAKDPPRRFNIPLPGLIFLCSPGKAPWVYAVKAKPARPTDVVYRAPLCNIFNDGKSCPGNHNYPADAGEIPDSFFKSFFSPTADLAKRSVKYPQSVVGLWESLEGESVFPVDDLVKHGTVKDLLQMRMRQ